MNYYDYLIVGSGFAGSVCAQALSSHGKKILIIDSRNHIGGNAYDSYDENGVLIHPYGPHIFHTNSEKIFRYLSQFTDWRFYEHKVRSVVGGVEYPIPINQITINSLYNLNLNKSEVEVFLESVRLKDLTIKSSEDVVLSSVGHDLCNKFFRGYTKKQWGLDLSDLSPGVASRIPTKFDDDCRYFADTYQFMPLHGYTEMFKRMLTNDNIDIKLSCDFRSIKDDLSYGHLIYTGPIDQYYDFCFGKLPYRSLKFEHFHCNGINFYQSTGTINYPNDYEFTRITEFKHLTGQKVCGTSCVREYPTSTGDPFYPIPTTINNTLFRRYWDLAESEKKVSFVGRLAQYKYYNMDQIVGSALSLSEKLLHNSA